jgi:hypothetical protein
VKDELELQGKGEGKDDEREAQREILRVLEKFQISNDQNDGSEEGPDRVWKYIPPPEVASKSSELRENGDKDGRVPSIQVSSKSLEDLVDKANEEELWDMLTEEEQKEFQKLFEREYGNVL